MDKNTLPNIKSVIRACQKYVYTDDAAAEIAVLVHENTTTIEDLDTDVLAYLRKNKPYERGWDTLAARLESLDAHTQKAFDSLNTQAQECLRLRTLDGYSIPEIAAIYALTEKKAQDMLKAARDTFWKTFVTSELRMLRTCRQFIYSDTSATDTAITISSKGCDLYSPDELDTYVLTYLASTQPNALNWDSIAARLEASDAHAQISFDNLDAKSQECLRLRTLDSYSIPEIAATCALTEKAVQAALKAARNNFWETFVTSEADTLRMCRQIIYSDADATDTAITVCSKNSDLLSSEESTAHVLAYLRANKSSWENWDTLVVHLRALDDNTLDTAVQKAFDSLEGSEIAFLRSRVGDGHTIQSIAQEFDYTEAYVEASLNTYRAKFWGTLANTDSTVLRECRRLIFDDADAEDIATTIHKHGGLVGNMRQHAYNYLKNRWDRIPDWNDPAFTKFIKAVVDPTDEKIAGFEAAKTAYDRLEYAEQDLLKYKVVEGATDEAIAAVSLKPLKQVEKDAASAKDTFWTLFTRERWSTLTYFVEELYKKDDSRSAEILKVEAEHCAAEKACDSLDEIDISILKKRCLDGTSIEEIAAETNTLPYEIVDILIAAREGFYDEFVAEIYRLWTAGVSKIKDDEVKDDKITVGKIKADEDDVHNAWQKLQELRYKIVPKNFRGWVITSAGRSEFDTLKEEARHRRITEEKGKTYINDEGELVPILSTTEKSLPLDEAFMQKEAEEQELADSKAETKCWHELLKMSSTTILKSKKPEKKLYLLINYYFQPKLTEMAKAKGRSVPEFQDYGEALAMAHINNLRQPKKITQAWVGEPIGETDRTIRRYTAEEMIPFVKKYAVAAKISEAELAKGCKPLTYPPI